MKRALVVLAACGHSTAPSPDAPVTPADAMVVQQVAVAPAMASSLTIPLAPTNAGDMILVAIASEGVASSNVATITADGRRFAADADLDGIGCPRALEVFSIRDIAANVTSVEVTLKTPVMTSAYALEVSGVSAFPLVSTTNAAWDMTPTNDVSLQLAEPAAPGQLVVGAITTCGTLTGLEPGGPFTPFDPQLGSDLAYLVVTAPGMYAPRWTFGPGAGFAYLINYR